MRAAGLTLLALLTLAALIPAQEPTKQDLLRAIEKQLKAANETAGPSVACVVVSRSDLYPKPTGAADQPGKLGNFDRAEFVKANPTASRDRVDSHDLSDPKSIPDHGYACGVVVDASGLILLPYHAVEGATKIYVHLPGRVGSYADIHAADTRADLAVLKLIAPPLGLKAIKFSDVRVADRPIDGAVFTGKLVVLMANSFAPGFGIDKPSAALGSLTHVRSKRARPQIQLPRVDPINDSYYKFGTLFEHDVKLNATVSGAALLNLDGEMIGLTTSAAAVGAGDAGYAIPMDNHVRRVVDVLRRGEEVEYGFMGILVSEHSAGVQVGGITKRGPADLAGIMERDVITHINGVRTTGYDDLLVQVGSALAGSKVKFTILRDDVTRDYDLTLAKFKHEQPFIASVRPAPVFGVRVDYSSIMAQRTTPAARVGVNGIPDGVSVREVAPNTPAATAFKKLGDVTDRWLIVRVNGNAVTNPAEFYKAAKGQNSIKLTVIDPSETGRPEREVTLP